MAVTDTCRSCAPPGPFLIDSQLLTVDPSILHHWPTGFCLTAWLNWECQGAVTLNKMESSYNDTINIYSNCVYVRMMILYLLLNSSKLF